MRISIALIPMIVLCTTLSNLNAQYFSGVITKELEVIGRNDNVDVDSILAASHGTHSKYYITDKYYKSVYFKEGKFSYSYTYHDETKRMYDDYADEPYITFRDSRVSNTEYYESDIYKDSLVRVLDYDCFVVAKKSDRGSYTSHYSKKIRVNYRNFEGHRVGNWYESLKEVDGCISLQTVSDHEDHLEIWKATKVEKRTIKADEFKLRNKPIAASYSALDKQVTLKSPTTSQIECYQNKVKSASKEGGTETIVYIRFLVSEKGEMEFIRPYEKDKHGLYKVALDIVENCGLEFIPGEIQSQKVSSEMFLPITFYL